MSETPLADEGERGAPVLGLRAGLTLLIMIPILLAALAIWFGSEYRRLGSSEDKAQQVHARQLLFSELFSSIKDAETGQRGFVITGDETFLGPYYSGRTAATQELRQLQALPVNATEQRRLHRIDQLVTAKFDEMERVVDKRRTEGLAGASTAVATGRGKALMDEIRSEADKARSVDQSLLAKTLAQQHRRTQNTITIIWLAITIIALAFFALGVQAWRGERRRTELEGEAGEAAARRQAIFDSTLDAIILINPSGSIETINRAAAQLFGYTDDQLIRRDISLVVDLAPGDGPFLERLGLGPGGLAEPFRHNLHAHRADGSSIPVDAALSMMPLPDGTHIVAALRDIAEREKVERIKDQFLSTVSHELRTPLTSIVGSLGLLRGGIDGELSAGAQRLLVIAENNANRLIRLVNDLLDIEKLESGQMAFDFQPIDLRDVAVRGLDTVRAMALTQEVELVLDAGEDRIMVRVDSERLIQVFTNLLGNAIRFTPAGRKVTLSLRRRSHHAEAGIIDQGPGVDAELKARLFTRFAQSIQGPVGQSRGTGLGLAISREIVRNHGGGIWYDPVPAGGSAFCFNLPLWNDANGDRDRRSGSRVLIYASGSEAAGIVGALEDRAILADVVEDAAAMMEALARRRYLALLIDCHHLGDDSRLFQTIRGTPVGRRLPIIAIAGDETSAELASLDVVDWIPRPLDVGRLNMAVASVVERAVDAMPLILHVDDDTDTLEITATALEGRARIAHATDVASARAIIARDHPDVVIVDLALPDGSGEDLLADLALTGKHATPVIIYSAQERNGAFAREVSAVLTKSRRSLSVLVDTINEILDREPDKGGNGG